jgi:rhomboid protease GluP
MIRKFFEDTVDLVLDGLARLGLLRGGASWWRERMRRRVAGLGGETENLRRAVAARHRMCRECRALVPVGERICSSCGASMVGVPSGGVGRLLSLLAPSTGSAATSLLGAIVVLYAATALAGAGPPSLFSIPGLTLDRFGAMRIDKVLLLGEWWRLVTAVFLHGGLLHLAFNGMALANLGPTIEHAIGGRRLVVLFVVTGVLSFVASGGYNLFLRTLRPSVGASGALFGLIGFGIVFARRHGGMYREWGRQLGSWALMGMLFSLLPGIDGAAHVGGFVAGAGLGLLITGRAPRRAWVDRAWTIAAVACALLPVAGFALALTTAAAAAR